MFFVVLFSILPILCLDGCTNIGPSTVPRDRFGYNTAISDSWKAQTLLNIVRLRYADMPVFVEVASVVSGYTLEGAIDLGGTVSSESAAQGDFLALGTTGKYTDRPTITYTPITGQKFNASFMTPIPPRSILFLMQTGWPVDLVFSLTVEAVNGLRSRVAAGANTREGDPGFYRVIELLRKIQQSGAVGMRILKEDDQKESTVLFFYRENLSVDIVSALSELNTLLGLRREGNEVTVVYGLIPGSDRELAMLTRSMLHIMVELAIQIKVPGAHITEGRTVSALSATDKEVKGKTIVDIHSGSEKPDNAYTAVRYKDYWFWIDDRDFRSKRTFTFLMILFSLTESGGKEGLPLVTIPAG